MSCRIVGQLFHFPALKIHTKKLTALRFRIAAVRLKVDVLAGGIEGVVREIQMKIQVLICQLRDGLSAHGIEPIIVCSFRNENDKAGFFHFFYYINKHKEEKVQRRGLQIMITLKSEQERAKLCKCDKK